MTPATRSQMQRLLASEFERHGWPYDLDTVPGILDEVERVGVVEPDRLAAKVPAEYIDRVGATRADLARAIAAAIGDRELSIETTTTITIQDNRYSINVAAGARISGGTFNTGSQISIQGDSPKDDILDAVATLVTAGLGGEWNIEAVEDLARVVAARDDVTVADVQQRTLAAAKEAGTEAGQVKGLLTQIAAGTATGVLTTGVTAALGALT